MNRPRPQGSTLLALVLAACGTAPSPTISTVLAPTESTSAPTASSSPSAVASQNSAPPIGVESDDGQCEGERIAFEHPPVELDLVEVVVPLGLMSDSHVTPVDHQYFQNFKQPDLDIAVFSPAAGVVTSIQHMNQTVSDQQQQTIDDYRLVIEHTCTISSIFIHVGSLSPPLAEVAPPPGEHTRVDVHLVAGETIGTFRMNVDYSVVDMDVVLPGLLVPEHYEQEPWKIHTPDPFGYFIPAVREALEAKSLRTAEPIGGELAYDVDGRLVGSWFLEGTNGYAGADVDRYWAGHLTIAYDLFDPDQIVVSIGTFAGAAAQFGVRGNDPDPADVSTATGIVAYELVDYDYFNGDERWDRMSLTKGIDARSDDGPIHGVALFQLMEDRILRAEFLPGVTAAEMEGFTPNAQTFER